MSNEIGLGVMPISAEARACVDALGELHQAIAAHCGRATLMVAGCELRPDVILASTSSRAVERLDALGFTVVRLKSASHADVRRTLALVARLLGTPDEAPSVWARIEREIAAAAARVPAALRGRRVYFEIGGGPYAAGTSSLIGETLARLGLVNIVPAELGPFPKLNPEFVVRAKPEIIMGVQREQAALAQRPGWATLPALRERRLCGYEPGPYDVLIRPGPRMGEAAALLADCLDRLERLERLERLDGATAR